MLPSKEKFQFYQCPYFLVGNCDRPFCHFKHAETVEGAKEKSPSLSESDTEEKCPSSCSCNTQQSRGTSGSSKLKVTKHKDESIKNNQNLILPKYRPTPISELQKRCEENLEISENTCELTNPESYSPNGMGLPPSVTYNPSDIASIVLKKSTIDASTLYSPVAVATSNASKVQYEPSRLEKDLKNYEPSSINLISVIESTYTPEDLSGNSDRFNYKPSNKQSNVIKQEPEYSPSGGSKNVKTRLKYTPSSTVSSSNKNQEYNPLKAGKGTKNASDKKESGQSKENLETLKYIPTEKSKLICHKKYEDVDIFSKAKSKSKSSSSKHNSSSSKHTEKSSDRSSHKHKRSHSSSSRDRKRVKSDSSSARADDKKEKSKKSTSQSLEKPDKAKSNKSDSQSSKHSSSKHSSSKHSTSKDHTNHKHSSSSKEKDKYRNRSSSRHNSDNKPSHRDKTESKRSHISCNKDVSKKEKDTNGSKGPEKFVDLTKENSQDFDFLFEESPDVVLKECFRIFETFEFDNIDKKTKESVTSAVQEKAEVGQESVTSAVQGEAEVEQQTATIPVLSTRKRIAHGAASQKPPQAHVKRIRPVSATAGQMLADRWRKQQELQKQEDSAATSSNAGVSSLLSELTGDYVPKPIMPWLKKDKANQASNSEDRTVAQSAKGRQRIAHKTKEEVLDRPIVRSNAGDKIPCTRRQHALDKLTEHCIRIYPIKKDAYDKAVELEQICCDKSQTVAVYNSLFVNQILRLKHTTTPSGVLAMNQQPAASNSRVVASYNQGVMMTQVVHRNYEFAGVDLYRRILKYKLTAKELKEYGYPYPHPELHMNGIADYQKISYPGQSFSLHHDLPPNKKECTRCHQVYTVDKTGMPELLVGDDKCCYHPKRAYKKRVRGNIEIMHECCSRSVDAAGCEYHQYHVTETLPEVLSGFVKTFNKGKKEHSGVFALDCEMCITTHGLEVSRITIVNEKSEQAYDTLIKPMNPILDYCTMFSGVTELMMKNVTIRLHDVQNVLLNLFSEDTILVGHSLNGDLLVLKLLHESVVDTSIVFPHKEGLPKRRALKNVCRDLLNKSIQNSLDGHDSLEDAQACMDLMLYKIREDAKLA